MENIEMQVKHILLERSLLYNEILPNIGNDPIFPDRDIYMVQIHLINKIFWVELLRDEMVIDGFELILDRETITIIDHPIQQDYLYAPPSHYPRQFITEFNIDRESFLRYKIRKNRKEKLLNLMRQFV